MRRVHKTACLLAVGLALCLMTGCGKGSKENKEGLAWYESGEYESAAAAFGDAIAADNTKSEYYINRALALIELEKFDQAGTCLDYADDLEPESQAGKRARGIFYYEQGMYGPALTSFEDAIALSSGKVGKVEYDILYYLADCQMKQEQYGDAAQTYTRLVDAGNTSADNYYLRGVAYLKSGKTGDAGLDFNRVTEAGGYADYWKVYSVLAENGETELGRQYLAKAVLLGGNLDSDHVWRGQFHYFLGNYEEALAEFNAVSTDALDADAYMMIAHIYQAMGDVSRVRAAFSVIEQKAPDDPYIFYQQTLFWMGIEEYEEAYACVSKGLNLEGDEYRQRLEYCGAVCLENLGRFQEALEAFKNYKAAYGSTAEIDHEIAFLSTRVAGGE